MIVNRYALKIEYFGKPFSGWQRQRGLLTVQGVVESAIRELEPKCKGAWGAGRTDSGVHALGQVAHCDLEKDWEPLRLADALNHHMRPRPVAIVGAARVPMSFSARFSAIERRYVYRIVSRRAPPSIRKDRAWHIRHQLELAAMRESASQLIGHHDFTTFRSASCQAPSPVRTLDALDISMERNGNEIEYELIAVARSFLHRQVRSLVGTLERVGAGAWTPDQVGEALRARSRDACGPVAPAHGLYLTDVRYPEELFDAPLPLVDPNRNGAAGEI